MGADDERFESRAGSKPGRDHLRERIAAARESIDRSIREVLESLEPEHEPLPAEVGEQAGRLAEARLEEATARLRAALDEVAEAEERVLATEARIAGAERRVTEAVRTAARAADWEQRMTAAAEVEDEAARRIYDAERRLLATVEERPPEEERPGPGEGA